MTLPRQADNLRKYKIKQIPKFILYYDITMWQISHVPLYLLENSHYA